MRQAYVAFKKRPPWPLQPYFEAIKCYKIRNIWKIGGRDSPKCVGFRSANKWDSQQLKKT
jgi:hypothetical protein